MAVDDDAQRLRTVFERGVPEVDQAAFVRRLRERAAGKQTRRTISRSRYTSVSRRRRGIRAAFFAATALAIVTAVAAGIIELVQYAGEEPFMLVIGDEQMTAAQVSGLHPVCVDGVWGYIDETGKTVVQPQFDSASDFSEGFARVAAAGKYGYIDESGAVVIAPQFVYARDFSDGMAIVGADGDMGPFGFIDTSGTLVTPMHFESVGSFSEGLALVSAPGDGFAFIDKAGTTVMGPYDFAWGFSEGLAYAEAGGRRGFVDRNGRWVTELASAAFDTSSMLSSAYPFPPSATGFSEGLMALRSTSGESRPTMGEPDKGYVDRTGAWAIRPQFSYVCDFSEGLAAVAVEKNGLTKWGYIDRTGAWIIQPQFDYTSRFSEGLAAVWASAENGVMKFGYIDKTGAIVIPLEYAEAGDFSGGIARVVTMEERNTGDPWYIDRTGTVVWPVR